MSHRVVIINKISEILTDEDVRSQLPTSQLQYCDGILNGCAAGEQTPDQVRSLLHRVGRAYASNED